MVVISNPDGTGDKLLITFRGAPSDLIISKETGGEDKSGKTVKQNATFITLQCTRSVTFRHNAICDKKIDK